MSVASDRVSPTFRTCFLRRRSKRRCEDAGASRGGDDRGEPSRPNPELRPNSTQGSDRVEDVCVDVDIAGDVGAAEAEFARRPQQATESVSRTHVHRRGASRTDGGAVPRLDTNRHIRGERVDERRHHVGSRSAWVRLWVVTVRGVGDHAVLLLRVSPTVLDRASPVIVFGLRVKTVAKTA